jgi:hypothetical protein
MRANQCCFRRSFCFFTLVITFGVLAGYAQDETLAEIKYKEDYDRLQKIVSVTQPIKRAEQLVALYRERPDMDSKLRDYADSFFIKDMDSLTTQKNFVAIRGITERALKARPQFGEAYFFYGVILKNEKKIDEAMNAFAKCYLVKGPLQTKGKQQLDIAYRATHKGSLIGQDKIIKNAQAELK